jgi:hypothetical protein
MHKHKRLRDSYRFKGYEPSENLTGIFGDPKARVIHFKRREKKQFVHYVELRTKAITTERHAERATFPAETRASTSNWKYAAWSAGGARK